MGVSTVRKIIVGLILLGASVVDTNAQTTQTLRAQWEMAGPPAPAGGTRPPFDVATAQSYIYKMYQVGSATGVTLTGVACTTTADQYVKTCAATVPTALNVAGFNLDMTATINGIETSHSTSAIVPPLFVPPAPPTNLRMIRVVGTVPVPTDADKAGVTDKK